MSPHDVFPVGCLRDIYVAVYRYHQRQGNEQISYLIWLKGGHLTWFNDSLSRRGLLKIKIGWIPKVLAGENLYIFPVNSTVHAGFQKLSQVNICRFYRLNSTIKAERPLLSCGKNILIITSRQATSNRTLLCPVPLLDLPHEAICHDFWVATGLWIFKQLLSWNKMAWSRVWEHYPATTCIIKWSKSSSQALE